MHAASFIVFSFFCAFSKTSTNTSATFWASRHLRVQPACSTADGVVRVLCLPVKTSFSRAASLCLASSLPTSASRSARLHRLAAADGAFHASSSFVGGLADGVSKSQRTGQSSSEARHASNLLESSLRRASSDARQASRASASRQAAFAQSASLSKSSASSSFTAEANLLTRAGVQSWCATKSKAMRSILRTLVSSKAKACASVSIADVIGMSHNCGCRSKASLACLKAWTSAAFATGTLATRPFVRSNLASSRQRSDVDRGARNCTG
mmetsp:Transcript_23297/g.60716  ORF Transcript_23297/g.60716 Transcript_23297/m.60716 type:complete len:268 (+) Transcript_23297:822-1625(+)